MRGFSILAFALVVLLALPAEADQRKLTGDEIHKLLSGNSVHGMWGQTEYKSYFGADGTTLYHPKGRDPSNGLWRTTSTQYCSKWNDRETCYDLYMDGDTIVWYVPETGHRYPSTLVKGNDTDF
jgi:hypothetical protein